MKKYVTLPALLLAIATLAACTAASSGGATASAAPKSESTAVYQQLTAKEAKARIDSGDALILLDVRTKEEYEAAHIEGAILIPNETITDKAQPERLPDLDAEILVYCRSGNRSKQTADKLVALGYTKVYDFGGIIDWPYDTVAGAE